MAQRNKSGDNHTIDYADLGAWAAAAMAVVGADTTAQWAYPNGLISFAIQNRSAGELIISTDQAAANGILLGTNDAWAWDCSGTSDDTIWVIDVGAAVGNVYIAIDFLMAS